METSREPIQETQTEHSWSAYFKRHGAAFTVFLAVAVLAWWANSIEPHVPSDHINIATMVLKNQEPQLFSRDLGFSDAAAFKFYTPAYRWLIATLSKGTGDLLTAPRILTPVLVAFYLCGAYALFFSLTGHRLASGLTAVASMGRWDTLIDSWGLDVPENMLPRSIFLAFVPWITLTFIRKFDRPLAMAATFLGIGFLANLHPVSAFGFVQIALLAILCHGRFAPRAFARCIIFGLVASLPVIGFAMTYWKGTQPADANAVPYAVILDIFKHRVLGFFPFPQERVVKTVIALAVPLALAAFGLRLRRQNHSLSSIDRWFIWFAVATVFVSFAGTAVLQMLSQLTESKPIIFDQMRSLRFVYLPLWIFAVYAVADLINKQNRAGTFPFRIPLIVAATAFCVVTSFPKGTFLERVWNEKVHAKSSLGREVALQELGDWVRTHTSSEALIDFDAPLFRFCSQRSLVFCRKDGGILLYSGNERLLEWHRRLLESMKLARSNSEERLAFAQKHGANYLVLEKTAPPLTAPALYENSHFRFYQVANGRLPE
jgi:hypothetical protein